MPSVSSAPPRSRAGTTKASASSAAGTTLLWPLSVKPLPARVAWVLSGSTRYRAVRSWCASTTSASPDAMRGSQADCTAAGAAASSAGATSAPAAYGAFTRPRPSSSITTIASTAPKPMPPCASGTANPVRPSSASSRYTSRVLPPDLAMPWRRSNEKPFSTQRATMSRRESWSSLKLKSMSASVEPPQGG